MMKNLQEVYPRNWSGPKSPIRTHEDSAMQILAEADLMPKLSDAQQLVFRLPGAKWEPPQNQWKAAVKAGWAKIDGQSGNALGQTLTPEGWAERERIYQQMKLLCKATEIKKRPGWQNVPGHMMAA